MMSQNRPSSSTIQTFDDDLMKLMRLPRVSGEGGKRKLSFTLLDDSQLSSKSPRIDSDRHKVAKLGGEITLLKHKLQQESIAKRRSVTLYEEEINSLSQQKQRADESAEEYKSKMKTCMARFADIRERLDECEKELTDVQNGADDKLYKLARANINRENELMEKIDSLEAQLNQTKGELLKEKMDRAESDENLATLKREMELKSKEVEEFRNYLKEKEESLQEVTNFKMKIQTLEDELSRNKEADALVKAMKSKLDKYPRLEKENQQLLEENNKFREREANVFLLQDENRTLRRKVDLIKQTQGDLASAEAEVEKLKQLLDAWEQCGSEKDSRSVFRSPDELHRHLRELQRDNLQLNECRGRLQSAVTRLENSFRDQKREVARLGSRLQESEAKCQSLESEVKRVNQRFKLVSQERDVIKKLLNEYEQDPGFKQDERSRLYNMESLLNNYKAQLADQDLMNKMLRSSNASKSTARPTDASISDMSVDSFVSQSCENLIADLRQRIAELEGKLFEASSENTTNKQRVTELEEKLTESSAEAESLKQKTTELQEQLAEVSQKKEIVEDEIERLTIQGHYDPTTTKVLHMPINPESMRAKKRAEELENLRVENEKLQRRVNKLEEARTADETLEMSKLDDPQNVANLQKEVQDLKSQLQSENLKAKRLIEMFKEKSQQLREACFCLLGHKLDIKESGEVKLTSAMANGPDEFLLFRFQADEESSKESEATSSGGRRWMLMETEYSLKLSKDIEHYIKTYGSIPALVCSVFLEKFGGPSMLE